MPRKPRIEFTGAFYHVIVRGNQKQRVFKDPADFQKYLLTLTVYKNRTGSRVYAYVLMNNHVHLLIETKDIPLSKIMQGLNQTYTMYFNRRYNTVGHLFQGRYKAILCDRDAYLLGLVQYIHRNPLRAKLADRLDAYPWSSHHAYTGKNNPLGIVDTDQVLRLFSENKARARRKYREFMVEKDAMGRSAVYATIDQRLLGDEFFVEEVRNLTEQKVEAGRKKKEHGLQAIVAAVEHATRVSAEEMLSPTRQSTVTDARRLVSLIAGEYGYTKAEIARYLRKDPAAITLYMRDRDEYREVVERIIKLLGNGA
jgi:REP element-mobilizing transposase RayT